jgi:hypothetical protein
MMLQAVSGTPAKFILRMFKFIEIKPNASKLAHRCEKNSTFLICTIAVVVFAQRERYSMMVQILELDY